MATSPDPIGGSCSDGSDWRNRVNDETPFFVGLEAIDCDIGNVGKEYVAGWIGR